MSESRIHETHDGWLLRGHPGHTIRIPKDGRWTFNGDYMKPTFSPSVVEGTPGDSFGHHIWIRDGVVEYLSDKKMHCCEGQPNLYPIPPWDKQEDEQ